MNAPLTERLIRFQHPEKILGYLGVLDDERLAALFGLDVGSYRRLRRTHADRAAEAAGELLAEPGFAAKVDRLPFAPGQRIAALGESTTDDLLSWFEILRHLLLLRRPEDGITPVNLAVGGQTTTQALAALPALGFQAPDWVLCMFGGNDVQRSGPDGPTVVSLSETERNLGVLREEAARRFSARWVWLTPSPVDEARVAAYPPFRRARLHWRNTDLAAVSRFLTSLPDTTVDTVAALARRPGVDTHLEDGLHLSLRGQQALAAALVEALADGPS
ncbi:SGNH/GDSL hydrolase family protein [Actinocorallia libanotica]|uniref:SGNH hydrolase-type esterase domain-containing protein n=1 Tax=Actinocorallia libanotica TaxID=46162 RepID=A0ABP4C6K2_9ACTN